MGNGSELCCWHCQGLWGNALGQGATEGGGNTQGLIPQGNRPKARRAGGFSLPCQQLLSLLQGISVNVMRVVRARRQLLQSCYCQRAGAAWGQESLINYRMSCSSWGSGPEHTAGAGTGQCPASTDLMVPLLPEPWLQHKCPSTGIPQCTCSDQSWRWGG